MKSMNMNIWVTGASDQFLLRGYWQNSFLCDRSILFVLTLSSDVVVLYGYVGFSILVLSTKNRYSSLLKKIFFFRKLVSKLSIENVQNFQ